MPAFPFLKLPAELRDRVYRYLLHAHNDVYIDSSEALKGRFWCHWQGSDLSGKGLTDREMYMVTATGLHPAILSVNRQTYLEATRVLYSENRFNFYSNRYLDSVTATAAVIPFLKGLSEGSRLLIREIEYLYVVTDCQFYPDPIAFRQDQVFAKTCDYLGQNLQLQKVTLDCLVLIYWVQHRMSDYKMNLTNINKHDWIQRLVPLAQKLKYFALVWGQDSDGDADLAHAVRTYLASKIAEASNTPCQIHMTHLDLVTLVQENRITLSSRTSGLHPPCTRQLPL